MKCCGRCDALTWAFGKLKFKTAIRFNFLSHVSNFRSAGFKATLVQTAAIYRPKNDLFQASGLGTYSDPLILDDVIDGEPLVRVCLQHAPDEILGILRHVLPLGIWKLVLEKSRDTFNPSGSTLHGQTV